MPGKNTHYEKLKNKWRLRHKALSENLFKKHKSALSQFAVGSLSGLFLLTSPHFPSLPNPPKMLAQAQAPVKEIDKDIFLIADLSTVLPKDVRALTKSEEEIITTILSRKFGFQVSAELEGKRLERNYGLIGAEQHLTRYPGDSLWTHFANQQEANMYNASGMAPGRGAWGYFASSKGEMTAQNIMREKYYIAVQTFLASGFNEHFAEYRDFFKYRKMLVVNSANGKAVVAVVGDAGPSFWTGKHLGGSPEVMAYLERVDGSQKGPVLFFFIDDQENKIPLGPISVK